MGIRDYLANLKYENVLTLGSPDVDLPINATADINIDAKKRTISKTSSIQNTSTYAPVTSDNRQFALILSSPNANLGQTKKDATSPSIVTTPTTDLRPITATGGDKFDIPLQLSPTLKVPSGLGSILLIGGLGVGGYMLLKKR